MLFQLASFTEPAAQLLAGSAPNRVGSSVSSQHLATSSKAAWSPGPETSWDPGNLWGISHFVSFWGLKTCCLLGSIMIYMIISCWNMLDLYIINLKSDNMYLEKQHLDDHFIGYIPDILNGSKLDHHLKLSLQITQMTLTFWRDGGVWFHHPCGWNLMEQWLLNSC
jgi:hypothetical protein